MIEYADFVGVGYGSEQIADQAVEFAIGDQVCGLLVSQGSTENTRKSDYGCAAACQAIWLVAGADQLTLNTEHCRLQRNKRTSLKVVP